MSAVMLGDQWAQLEAQDAGAYNDLYPKFNADVAWAGAHCIAKPPDPPPSK